MSRIRSESAKVLQEEIRRQFGSARTARYLRMVPGLQPEPQLPTRLVKLLKELDRREADGERPAPATGRSA